MLSEQATYLVPEMYFNNALILYIKADSDESFLVPVYPKLVFVSQQFLVAKPWCQDKHVSHSLVSQRHVVSCEVFRLIACTLFLCFLALPSLLL